ncbi:MAG: CDP-diacylglycerol--glycerol-3-phosphate 3-phosphatidyltransferase [Eubacteriales bacterium]|nr:CDP-diacylglycerol--glycerol-3-phosphate 3-phosphatidyltransferase [Eubacteriales bacterium]
MNTANKLTVTRALLIPVILAVMFEMPESLPIARDWNGFQRSIGMIVALILFLLASLTDFLDGHLARRLNLVTNFGKFLDPIADKLLILSVMIAFTGKGYMSTLVPIITLARDFIVTGMRLLAIERGRVVAANRVGKWKTFTQMIALILCYLYAIVLSNGHDYAWLYYGYQGFIWISIFFALWSCYAYFHDNIDMIREQSPKSL